MKKIRELMIAKLTPTVYFKKMLQHGNPPDSWEELVWAAKEGIMKPP